MIDDISFLIDSLNDAQREVVAAPLGQQLVLAGAGSGKTRVLVHRIAWLMYVEQASPFSILAVTFTNKAAAEMRGRIEQLLKQPTQGMWVGTFHGLAHRLLRNHWQEAKLIQNFQVLDSDDQLRLIKRVLKDLNIDDQRWQAREVQWFINNKKDQGIRPNGIQVFGDVYISTMVQLYQAYEEYCERAGVVDFAELLLRALDLWRDNPELLKHYQQRFAHVLVDEFQDTNAVQYAWLKILAKGTKSLMVVGDDDQSIYGWRGAKIENIQSFTDDFPEAVTYRLEQNYRSTNTILKAANALIDNNQGRLGKELWTEGNEGELIALYAGFNEQDEARYILERIQEAHREGFNYQEIAVLYRSNAQSRVLEENLWREGIPYRIYGGLRFFERAEIKNALAYLRLIRSKQDDSALERIINLPTRGIGERTIEQVRQLARELNISLWQSLKEIITNKGVPARACSALNNFVLLINRLTDEIQPLKLSEQIDLVIKQSGLLEFHRAEKGDKGEARVENLEELVSAASAFEHDEDMEDNTTPLAAFLDHAALEAGEKQAGDGEDCVQLMTLHNAKGLEFPLVFLTGLEEGLFPHQRNIEDIDRLEEERRLAYVGITRAMQQLVLTYAETRRLHGNETYNRISRFVREIPTDLLREVRLSGSVSHPFTQQSSNQDSTGLSLGQRVLHPLFGEGVILNAEGSGAHTRIQVKFDNEGSKWLILAFAKLQVI
ncbi:DNA helicase II [Entomomonas asaccharolytica]|uniref:DNA 3'-5' helicase n=1 Tax=Entomomonas asaccharolytica TaxID=2785331 RepID=A0A974RWZ6_9GAMM|nr:DNA helicase II [Entomomonas asaccharolytica]QQP85716.1 DNA helicase II [Entomomonas asaccharolytica]